ncbi:MAG: glycosyltransferase [Chloroflexi bacterium]|nr:glycosyltransferase [Chloroflexota bacterium]
MMAGEYSAGQEAADASVIICAYTEERWQDLIEAVDSIKNQVTRAREVIVVIDHNPALFHRASHFLSGVKVVENQEARGLSGARNTGIAHACGELLMFMDEDATADPLWLHHLLTHYRSPGVSGVGGRIDPWWMGGRPTWFPEEFQWVVGCSYRGMPEETSPVRNLIGANMSFRRQVFEQAGRFAIGIGRVGTRPTGCEETELCIRASEQSAAALFLFDPRAAVQHRVPKSRASLGYFLHRCFAEGRSKAQVAQAVGAQRALASERAYTLRVLPHGVLAGIRDALHGDVSGLGRTAAIVTGLALTAIGYLSGRLFRS